MAFGTMDKVQQSPCFSAPLLPLRVNVEEIRQYINCGLGINKAVCAVGQEGLEEKVQYKLRARNG